MRQYLIKEATEKRLLEQGLQLKLSKDDSAIIDQAERENARILENNIATTA